MNLRTVVAASRRLFPAWPWSKRKQWCLARIRVDRGTWRFPLGEKYIEPDVPEFLRKLPPGPPLETVITIFDRKVRALRFASGMLR
jgi:hypothetical protein